MNGSKRRKSGYVPRLSNLRENYRKIQFYSVTGFFWLLLCRQRSKDGIYCMYINCAGRSNCFSNGVSPCWNFINSGSHPPNTCLPLLPIFWLLFILFLLLLYKFPIFSHFLRFFILFLLLFIPSFLLKG